MKAEATQTQYRSFNLNNYILVHLTDLGYQHMADQSNAFLGMSDWEYKTPQWFKEQAESNGGYTQFQTWEFMQIFGALTGMARPQYFHLDVLFAEKDLTTPDAS